MEELRSWQQTQGHIVTGGGQVVLYSSPYTDFLPSDLPHYLLTHDESHDTFRRWLKANRRSDTIVGCWSRPIFAGGWKESSFHDTSAYNLQTPSLFIDMRFPTNRPTNRLRSMRNGLRACSADDFKALARQHCFSGYSLPEINPSLQRILQRNPTENPTFTRHHIIDWNLHPFYPRNRPNRWWIEVNDTKDGEGSFKEHSAVRNPSTGLPVYFERWARIPPYLKQRTKYFAARKEAAMTGGRDAVLIVVGDHFALAVDRPPLDLSIIDQDHAKKNCAGGGAMFVDYLLDQAPLNAEQAKDIVRQYLDLEGSYGLITTASGWTIEQSTHPWLEMTKLISTEDSLLFTFEKENMKGMQWTNETTVNGSRSHCFGGWEVLECSFTAQELNKLFQPAQIVMRPMKLRSKL